MAENVYWIWLQQALGIGSVKVDAVLRLFGSPKTFYHTSREQLAKTGLFAAKELARIKSASLAQAYENERLAIRHGCRIVTPENSLYPQNLTNIDGMPCVLYVLGDLAGLDRQPAVTLVGTRSCTQYGEQAAYKLAFDLSAAGCTVVSGLAPGIDSAAHEGALAARGRTIGLLACGIDVDYPSASHALKRAILESGGALISEFPFGEKAYRHHFNIRNRLMSGIADGVVVVQAPEMSGALNTARHATEQNREVFAVPGGIFDESMSGCNLLLRDGAKIVINVYSILEEFSGKIDCKTAISRIRMAARASGVASVPQSFLAVAQEPAQIPEMKRPLPQRQEDSVLLALGISEGASTIYSLLDTQPLSCDTLLQQSGLSATALMAGLTELEMHGLARSLPGRQYMLADENNMEFSAR